MNKSKFEPNISLNTRYTLALILAGGKGSRLRDLTKWRVKPAVPFGGKFRIIDFALSNCINSGIRKISITTQYKAQSLIRHITQGWGMLHSEFGEFVEVLPAQQRLAEKWYSGTADAVYQNIDIIRKYNPEYVMILGGDHIYKMDYGEIIAYHKSRNADLTVSCIELPVEDANQFGVMSVDEDNRVIDFEEKPEHPQTIPGQPDKVLASMGIYVFNPKFLFDQLFRDANSQKSSHDFGKDIIPSVIKTSKIYAYPFRNSEADSSGYWRDVGTIDSYWKANMELIGVTPELNIYDDQWPIRTNLRQYPPAKFVFNSDGRRGMAVDSMISEGCIVSGAYVEESLLFSNVHVEDYSKITQSVVLSDVVIGSNCRIHKAIIDKGCTIPDGAVIGEDLEHDKQYFHVSDEGIVLVTPDMLKEINYQVQVA
ncbi:MAG TPA: glucose-1-phosphate adenylyltransferase [Balneolales bacterium]|nr:glucose-1-phosphate adenylyltransferase [Balneolales bacterium]